MENTALFRPVTITYETLDRLTKEKDAANLIALYMSYVAITQWQNTTSIKATTDFMAKRLSWDNHKVIATKKKLEKLGLIVPMTKKGKNGRVIGHFIRIMYIITSQDHNGQKPQGGENHSVVFAQTSTINEQLSAINLKESASPPDSFFSGGSKDTPTPPPAQKVLEALIAIVNPKEKVTQDRIRVLNGRLKDYTAQDLLGAAKAFSKSTWHKENKQMSIDNLIAPSKIGRWYQASLDAKPQFGPTPEQAQRDRFNEARMAAFRAGEDVEQWDKEHNLNDF